MAKPRQSKKKATTTLLKCPSGVPGLDEITCGGLPRGRTTLVCGGVGSGKTLLGLEFLARGARDYGEPGVFVSFEERPDELITNTNSLGFELADLVKRKQLLLEHVVISRSEIVESGEYDLDGLFIRLGAAIEAIGAQRVVLDTIEVLFSALSNLGILRAELRRLSGWLKDRGMTTLIAGERGDGGLTREGLEEYVCDCVILLDQRVSAQITTRRLRVVKYRGSPHGGHEYPFVINDTGVVVLPASGISLNYPAQDSFASTGIDKLDAMLGKQGYYRGSTTLVSGRAGTGKTSIAAQFVVAACARGERALFCALEESPEQVMRNMRSIGLDLRRWFKKGLLEFAATRPSAYSLDAYIGLILQRVDAFDPHVLVIDPMSSFEHAGSEQEVRVRLMHVIDQLKARAVTALFTDLSSGPARLEESGVGVSSLIDTWLLVRDLESAGERSRSLVVIKSRGRKHSKQVRELLLTDQGVDLADVYIGPAGVLVGSPRAAQQAQDEAAGLAVRQQLERMRAQLASRRRALRARVEALEADFAADADEIELAIEQETSRQQTGRDQRKLLATNRERVQAVRRPAGKAKRK